MLLYYVSKVRKCLTLYYLINKIINSSYNYLLNNVFFDIRFVFLLCKHYFIKYTHIDKNIIKFHLYYFY